MLKPLDSTAVSALPSFFGIKVVTASEMARIEKLAIHEGGSPEAFIDEAGKCIAAAVIQYIDEHRLPKSIALLIGKGNKGADAFAAGKLLIEEGFRVKAFLCFSPESCSELNQKKREAFIRNRGQIVHFFDGGDLQVEESLILDGLLGTGFKGDVTGKIETAILVANESKKPIIAIDLPSGLDGTTGEVKSACINASLTVTLGMAKSGLFLREGWNHTGKLIAKDFGLPAESVQKANEVAYLPEFSKLPLPRLIRNRHKYQAGYVIGYSGSDEMHGAPKLAGLAALRAGAGIVRIFHKGSIGDAPFELIHQKWNEKEWKQELKRADAIFGGPGLGKGPSRWMKGIGLPAVIDADAIQENAPFPKQSVLTPHRGEMLRLLGLKSPLQEEELLARCQKFVEHKKVILVLKGAPTFLFAHGKPPLIIPRGDPGMATAGAGDVLTGIIAGLLAQKLDSYEAAAVGSYLHAVAGECAALQKTSHCLIARDLIEFLPNAFRSLLQNSGF